MDDLPVLIQMLSCGSKTFCGRSKGALNYMILAGVTTYAFLQNRSTNHWGSLGKDAPFTERLLPLIGKEKE